MGTSAAEGWPAVFCQCESCGRARGTGGPNIRTRSSVLINLDLKVDLPPDTYQHVLKYALDLAVVEHIAVTHSHQDHFYADELNMRGEPFAYLHEGKSVKVYGNKEVCFKVRQVNQLNRGRLEGVVETQLVEPFKTYRAGRYLVTPLLADHAETEQCLVYLISDGTKTILHGHDSGWFPDATWAFMENHELDMAVLDCTNGPLPGTRYHMGVEGVLKVKDEMVRRGIASSETAFVATHFSHNGGLLHEQLVSRLEPAGVTVAYDGLTLDL